MKILYLFSTAETSVAIVTLNQIKALRLYYPNLIIKIACVNYYEKRSVLSEEEVIKKRVYRSKLFNQIKNIQFVYKLKKEFKPDITISNLGAVNAYNCALGKNDVKVCIFHSPFKQFHSKGIISKWLNFLSKRYLYMKCNALIGISQEVVNDLEINIPCSNVNLYYNIHDVNLVRKRATQNLSIDICEKNKFEMVCLGAIDRNKCQDLLIKALIMSEEDYHLYIVGKVVDKDYYKELLSLIKVAKIEDKVSFISFLDNPYPLLSRVDLLVSSSISEGLPGVVIESLLLNTPVVCSDSSLGVWEILSQVKGQEVLKDVVRTSKGLIIPNPNSISEEIYVRLLLDAITIIKEEYKTFKESDFEFEKKISFDSVDSFYNMLEDLKNENIS